jgi:hypothetical protein
MGHPPTRNLPGRLGSIVSDKSPKTLIINQTRL